MMYWIASALRTQLEKCFLLFITDSLQFPIQIRQVIFILLNAEMVVFLMCFFNGLLVGNDACIRKHVQTITFQKFIGTLQPIFHIHQLVSTSLEFGQIQKGTDQLREKIGVMFGNPETTTGGNALKFYASVRLDIRRSTQIKDGENVLGNRTKVKIVKNKVAPPFKVAEFDIMYGEGISKTGEILDLAVEFEIIKKAGSWFSYGETKLGQGRDAVKTLIKDNPELADELEVKIKAHIKELANE